MKMRKTIITAALVAAVTGCVKIGEDTTTNGISPKEEFNAWLETFHKDLAGKSIYPGYYILEESEGSGAPIGTSDINSYARVSYTCYSLSGSILNTTEESIARRLGTYKKYYYYGASTMLRGSGNSYAGIDEALSTMKAGGRKKIIVPGWLLTNSRYSTEDEYLANFSGGSAAVYDLKVEDAFNDVTKHQIDSIERYISRVFNEKPDSLKYGFYKIRTGEPSSDIEIPNDSTVYINYICRRLDGTAVDSNIRDTAERYGFRNDASSYTPVSANYAENYSDITITSNKTSVIGGFALLLKNMKPHEKASGIFYSNLGYGAQASNSIPAFSPLRFDIELVDKPQ